MSEQGVVGFDIVAVRVTDQGRVEGLKIRRTREHDALQTSRRLKALGWRSTIVMLGVMLLALAGCAQPKLGMHYGVMIDPSMQDHAEQVVDACEAWMRAVPGLALRVSIGGCTGAAEEICMLASDATPPLDATYRVLPYATTTCADDRDSAVVRVWTVVMEKNPTEDVWRNTLAHELGHALAHSSRHIEAGNLMSAKASGARLEAITDQDVAYFWAAR